MPLIYTMTYYYQMRSSVPTCLGRWSIALVYEVVVWFRSRECVRCDLLMVLVAWWSGGLGFLMLVRVVGSMAGHMVGDITGDERMFLGV